VPEGDDAASLAVWGSHPLWSERWLDALRRRATRELLLADNRPRRSDCASTCCGTA
jgi:hypothetical protein